MLPVIDFVFIGIILVAGIAGIFRGFVNSIFGLGAPVVSAWVAFLFYGKLVTPLQKYISNEVVCIVIGFFVIFILVFLVMKIIQQVLKNIFEGNVFSSLDRFLGFIFGLVTGLAIVVVAIMIISAIPWGNVSSILEGSFFNNLFGRFIPDISKEINVGGFN